MSLARFFIDRPIFAGVISVAIFLVGLISMFQLPVSEYPEIVPPSVIVRAQFPGANPEVMAETVATPLEEQINGVENMLYMQSLAATDGTHDADRHLQARLRSRSCDAARAEPGQPGPAALARSHAPARRGHGEELARSDDGGASAVAQRPLRP